MVSIFLNFHFLQKKNKKEIDQYITTLPFSEVVKDHAKYLISRNQIAICTPIW